MNFFKHQDDARRKSGQLILLFAVAIFILVAITTVTVAGLLYYFDGSSSSIAAQHTVSTSFLSHLKGIVSSTLILWIAGGVLGVVLFGSLLKSWEIKRGGDYVAQALGGRLLIRDHASPSERVLLNVTEEMAIASGMPLPRVYLLDEPGINAFAAGTKPSNAVIGITKGGIDAFTREQLQGVIAHEYSHIHHGDMSLNMRLIAVLHGILMIGLVGQMFFRGSLGRSAFGARRNKRGGSGAIFGLVLMAIGFSGVFFGNLIKAAVSRQREFLADASAVQFTRNPQGIATALLKIQRNVTGSQLRSSHAAEYSHFYFANGITSFFSKMFATHPPLDERIERVAPNARSRLHTLIDQESEKATSEFVDAPFTPNSEPLNEASPTHSKQTMEPSTGEVKNTSLAGLDGMIGQIGEFTPSALTLSYAILANIPTNIHQACESPYQARAVVYALLLDKDSKIKEEQLKLLSKRAHPATYAEFLKIYNTINELDEQLRFPLLQLAQPSLLNLSEPQRKLFSENLLALAKADEKISLKEWAVMTYALAGYDKASVTKYLNIQKLSEEITQLLSFVCLLNDARHQQASLDSGLQLLFSVNNEGAAPQRLQLKQLNNILVKLKQLKPLQKPQLLKAISHVMFFDKKLSSLELNILRTFAAVLEAPIPLMVDKNRP